MLISRWKTLGDDQIVSFSGSVIYPSVMGKYLTRVLARASCEFSGVLWAFLVECLGAAVNSFNDAGTLHYGIWTSQDLEASKEEGNYAYHSKPGLIPDNKELGKIDCPWLSLFIYGKSSLQGLKQQLHGAQQNPWGFNQMVGNFPWWVCFICIVTWKLFVAGDQCLNIVLIHIKLQIADFSQTRDGNLISNVGQTNIYYYT